MNTCKYILAILGMMFVKANASYSDGPASVVSKVTSVYVNEAGAPFIRFATTIDAGCAYGNGLFLYNLEAPQSSDLQKLKASLILTAASTGANVRLYYKIDTSLGTNAWNRCYISGIALEP